MMEDLERRPHGHYFNLYGAVPREELGAAWRFVVHGTAVGFPTPDRDSPPFRFGLPPVPIRTPPWDDTGTNTEH